MRCRRLAFRKVPWARIAIYAWLPELGRGLVSTDDLVTAMETATVIAKTRGSLCGCSWVS